MSKKDIVLTDETPTVQKIKAVREMLTSTTVVFETVVPQIILTVLFGGAAVYLAVTGQPIPDWLQISLGAIFGFYFGSDFQYRRLKGKVEQSGRE